MNLKDMGWTPFFEAAFTSTSEHLVPARVVCREKASYRVWCETGYLKATVCGRMRHKSTRQADLPTTGDWVVIDNSPGEALGITRERIPRKTELSRKAPISGGRKIGTVGDQEMIVGGRTEEQILAANVDFVFHTASLLSEANLRMIDRVSVSCQVAGIGLVLLLNKADAVDPSQIALQSVEIERTFPETPCHVVSGYTGLGLDELRHYLKRGVTVCLTGQSGVGKSTLINRFLGTEQLATGPVREGDNKGRHITTRRELICLPDGGIVIDNPGIREFQIWSTVSDVERNFEQIAELSSICRFSDCSHTQEPGCEVLAALEDGRLQKERYESFVKLQNDALYLLSRKKGLTKREKLKWKKLAKRKNIKF